MAPRSIARGDSRQGILAPLLFMTFLTLGPVSVQAQVIGGVLLDARNDTPIPFGKITLLKADATPIVFTLSDREGRFGLDVPDPGTVLMYGEAFYYFSLVGEPFEVGPGDTVNVEFRLPPNPEMLDPIVVEARRLDVHLLRAGFYDRQTQGFGRFITREEIEKKNAIRFTDLLWGVPGVRLIPGPFGAYRPVFSRASISERLRGRRCRPAVYLDGISWGTAGGGGIELDDLLPASDVAAVELYANASEAPAQYGGLGARCGVIVIWTRR